MGENLIKNPVTKVFQLLLLLSPITICTGVDMDVFDVIFFRTGIMVMFFASLLDKPRREIPQQIIYTLLGLGILCLANLFNHGFAQIILANTMSLFMAVLGFCIAYRYWDENASMIKPILIAGGINLLFYAFQLLGVDPVFEHRLWGGLMGNVARFSTYFALVASFLNLISIAVIIPILVLITKQYVLLIPLFMILFLRSSSRLQRVLLIIASLLAVILFRKPILFSLIHSRIEQAWIPALTNFFDSSLIGLGIGQYTIPELGTVFNSYLQFIVGVGIGGLIWLGYVFHYAWKNLNINRYSFPLIVLALVALIEYPIELPRLWILDIGIIFCALVKAQKGAVA